MRVGCVRGNQTMGFRGILGRFEVFKWVNNLGIRNLEVNIEHLHRGLDVSPVIGSIKV